MKDTLRDLFKILCYGVDACSSIANKLYIISVVWTRKTTRRHKTHIYFTFAAL